MLEERYGRQLLERTRGNVQLTPAGEILYQVSKDIVQRYQDLEARLQAMAQVVAGPVRVATVHSIGLYELSGQLKRYLRAFPQVHLHLEYSRSNKIYEDAVRGNIDLGVVAYPSKRPQITVIPFREDRLVLACPPGHPLARHRQISISKLNGEPLVGYERDIPTRKETDRMLRRYGVEVRGRRDRRAAARTSRPSASCTAARSAKTSGRAAGRRAAGSTGSGSGGSRSARARRVPSSSTCPGCT